MNWEKLGRIFDPTQIKDKDWMKGYAQCVSTIIFDDFVRVYFSCRPDMDSQGQYVSYTTFIDLNRSNLKEIVNISDKPIMDLGELGCFDEFAIYPTSVIRYDTNRLALYYAGWTRCKSTPYTVSIGLAFSDDNGLNFKRLGKGPILTNSLDEPFELSGPKVRKINGLWYMYYLAGEQWNLIGDKAESVYKIRLATSIDGINWEKYNKSIIPTVLPEHECQAGPDVIFCNNKYHMFFSYRYAHNFKNKERGYKIGYAFSDDGINWTRDDEKVGIGLSETGWDSEMQHYPHVFELDGNFYMIYNGNEFGKYGFGLAILKDKM